MARRKTPEEERWLAENYADKPNAELLREFRETFGWASSMSGFASWASDRGLRKARNLVKWAEHPEYDEFLRGFIPGHEECEIIAAFEGRFGIRLTESQVGNRKAALGVKSGTRGGCFKKGQEPPNKGRTWDEMGIPQESRERMRSGQFRRGNMPHNAVGIPVGSERVTKEGYVEVKVRERRSRPNCNDNWVLKQRRVWERENGRALPKDWVVLFADHDKRNFDPENLVAIPQRVNSVIQTQRLAYSDRDTLMTAIKIAELKMRISKAEKAPRACKACGEVFEPRYAHQRTCDACIANSKKERNG